MEENKEKQKFSLSPYLANWLKSHLLFWVKECAITEEQSDKIKSFYLWPQEPSRKENEKSAPSAVKVIQNVGAFLIGVGILSLVAYNWQYMGRAFKLLIISAVLLITQGSSFLLYSSNRLPRAARSLNVMGNLFYGGAIWLIAQIYHLNLHYPTGFLFWALGVIPFAFVLKSRTSYFLSVFLFIVWTFTESLASQKPHIGFLFMLLFLLIPLSYYLRTAAGLFICLVTGGVWLLINNIFWFEDNVSLYLIFPFALYGLALLSASLRHASSGEFTGFRTVYFVLGILFFGIATAIVPFLGFAQWDISRLSLKLIPRAFWIVSLFLISFTAFCLIQKPREDDAQARFIRKALPVFVLSAFYVFVLPYLRDCLLFNLLPVAAVLYVCAASARSRLPIIGGIFYFSLWLPFCLFKWKQPGLYFLLLLSLGAFIHLYGWKSALAKEESTGAFMKATGLLAVNFAIYVFSFQAALHSFTREFLWPNFADFWTIALFFLSADIFLLINAQKKSYPLHPKGMVREERMLSLIFTALPAVLFFLLGLDLESPIFTLFFNFFYFFCLILLILAGYRRREAHLKVIALVFFALLVGSRYLELEWSFIYKSVLFIVTGIVVLAAGVSLEKNKNKVAVLE